MLAEFPNMVMGHLILPENDLVGMLVCVGRYDDILQNSLGNVVMLLACFRPLCRNLFALALWAKLAVWTFLTKRCRQT